MSSNKQIILAFRYKVKSNRGDTINRIINVLQHNENKYDPIIIIQDSRILTEEQYKEDVDKGFKFEKNIREFKFKDGIHIHCYSLISMKVHSFMMIANIIEQQIGDELLMMRCQ